jgi:hypothetical protein
MTNPNALADAAPAEKNQNNLHAPLRPLGIKAVIAATMMLKRKPAKKS